jgi:succinyl-CoA synthetase beta subunit
VLNRRRAPAPRAEANGGNDVDTATILEIVEDSRETGWVLEPDAKRILALAGVDVPRFAWAGNADQAAAAAAEIGYPVVVKVVSPRVVHKTEVGGVVTGVGNERDLRAAFERLSRIDAFQGVVVDETLSGVELIVGAKNDAQFGPVILLGIGGVGVEIYRDTAIRMAPVSPRDVESMLRCLRGRALLEGFRGKEPASREAIEKLVLGFSDLVMAIGGEVESIDLNPVICSSRRAAAADARIMLTPPQGPRL